MGKKVVIALHGIRTRGVWQKQLTPVLAKSNLIPYPLDYGRFGIPRFLLSQTRDNVLDWFHREYDQIRKGENVKRPSIIAHSFGTYVLSQLLTRYPEVRFDKVILAGSIIAENFDWEKCIASEQVLQVHNEIGTKDIWPRVVKRIRWLIPGGGDSGTNGFINSQSVLENKCPVGHSGTFFSGRYDEWVKFLLAPVVCKEDKKSIKDLLAIAVDQASQHLGIQNHLIRANVFVSFGETLLIPKGLSHNMDGHPDESIMIPVGMGATGRMFKDTTHRSAYFAIHNGTWGVDSLPPAELSKVHPALRWIVSLPLSAPKDGRLIGVMNVDGLAPITNQQALAKSALLDYLAVTASGVSEKLCSLQQGEL
jgi:pimeloyl-ACP methyl ester carboxylesterase